MIPNYFHSHPLKVVPLHPAPSLIMIAVLLFGVSQAGAAFLNSPIHPASHANDGGLAAWPVEAHGEVVAEFIDNALPVAGNKADLDNTAPGFFRVPAASPVEPGVILYVGLRAEAAPAGSQYRTPLFSGSVESLRLGLTESRPAPQTVGDIGEIHDEDAAPTHMAYIVYRLDFGTRTADLSLFATPTLTTEPLTMNPDPDSPVAINAKFAWESIQFITTPALNDRDLDWQTERYYPGRLAPEPTSTALLAAGLLGLASRRRRA